MFIILAQVVDSDFEKLGEAAAILLVLGMMCVSIGACLLYFIGWWLVNRPAGYSPYWKERLIPGENLTYEAVKKINSFILALSSMENPMIDIEKVAVCRQTGRIFPNSVSHFGNIKVRWSFIKKRYPGHYVSWGSLKDNEKGVIRAAHGTLEGFQVLESCPKPLPKDIYHSYANSIPGPLYVDKSSKVLVGWKCIPDSSLEVLVVQLPKN